MCGICGEVRFDGGVPDVAAVDAMTCEMTRRGPTAPVCSPRAPWHSGTVG